MNIALAIVQFLVNEILSVLLLKPPSVSSSLGPEQGWSSTLSGRWER